MLQTHEVFFVMRALQEKGFPVRNTVVHGSSSGSFHLNPKKLNLDCHKHISDLDLVVDPCSFPALTNISWGITQIADNPLETRFVTEVVTDIGVIEVEVFAAWRIGDAEDRVFISHQKLHERAMRADCCTDWSVAALDDLILYKSALHRSKDVPFLHASNKAMTALHI